MSLRLADSLSTRSLWVVPTLFLLLAPSCSSSDALDAESAEAPIAVESCAGLPAWHDGTTATIVQNRGNKYACKVPGWCSMSGAASAYEPGAGWAWQEAWTLQAQCSSSGSGGTGGTGTSGGTGGKAGSSGSSGSGGNAGSGGSGGSTSGGTGGSSSTNPGGTVVKGIRHPGLVNSEAQLLKMRAVINGTASHPMKAGWDKMRSTQFARLTYRATPYAVVHVVGSGGNAEERAMRSDAVAAYAHALQWVVTQNTQHSQKAIEILNAWSRTLRDVVPASSTYPGVQDELEVAWYAPIYLNAAEIIRHHRGGAANWSQGDQSTFSNMVALFRRKADAWAGSKGCCPNQGISVALSRVAIGIYMSDKRYFDAGVQFLTGTMLPRSIASSGELLEINRLRGGDCGHSAYNIEGIFDIAEIAWHQGNNLYANGLLPRGLEYMARLITTGAQTSKEGFVTCSTQRPTGVEMAYNHYVFRTRSASLPSTQTLLSRIRPVDQGTGKFVPWDTLTHAETSR